MNPHAVLERRRTQREALIRRAESFVIEIERKHRLRAAVVFGSVARGDFNLWSDVDLLLILEEIEGTPIRRAEALGPRPPLVQPIVWTVDEWHRQTARRNPIATEAAHGGVWLRGAPDPLSGDD